MPLVTANQFQLGRDFSQIGKGVAQGAQLANQFQIGQQRERAADIETEKARVLSVIQGASEIQNLPNDASKISALIQRKDRLLQQGLPTQDTDEALALYQSGESDKANALIDGVVNAGIQQGILKAPATGPSALEQAKTAQVIAQTGQIGKDKPVQVSPLDAAKIKKIEAETAALSKGTGEATPALDSLVAGASPELQQKAKAAYDLSGGGDKGVKALTKVLTEGSEIERRAAAPETLKANFPQADAAELSALQAVVDSAKTTESGFKEANKLREKQRQVKKGKVFQGRAVQLLDRILANDELNDVVGSIEGSDESLIPFGGQKIRGDKEAEAIADIEEAGNILTADNLDIMSGVLSETDIKIIANLAGGALNRKRSEETFIRDVTELRNKLAGQIGKDDEVPEGMKDNGDGTFTLPSGQIVRRKRG